MLRKPILVTLLIIVALGYVINAQTPAFTYQGRLTESALPAAGTYQMQFSVWDAVTMGTQQGTTITNNAVTVANGVFTVQLDFTAAPFATGANRWIEIAVRKAADPPGFTTLTPRQQITSNPFAIRSASASGADSLSAACALCVTDVQIAAIDGSKVTGTVADARLSSNVVLKDATQTLTNKTIDSTTNTVTTDKLRTATGVVDVKSSAAPTAGQVLTSTGPTAATWQTPTVGSGSFYFATDQGVANGDYLGMGTSGGQFIRSTLVVPVNCELTSIVFSIRALAANMGLTATVWKQTFPGAPVPTTMSTTISGGSVFSLSSGSVLLQPGDLISVRLNWATGGNLINGSTVTVMYTYR